MLSPSEGFIVYLPTPSTPSLQSFSSPILNLHDSRVSAPFFGPNVWSAAIQPVTGGGIPSSSTLVEVKITFKEGGAFDFHANYERIKERLQQAVEVARENGQMSGDGVEGGDGRGGGALSRINMAAVDLEELPAYEATSSTQVPATSFTPSNLPTARADTRPGHQEATSSPNEDFGRIRGNAAASPEETFSPPTEPPPGYEEAQRESVANELERVVSNFQSSSKLEDSHS
ncbi:MAG: hypothetical protein M1837_004382 [Sclerophora amabilis]|nr:MAG: hypothetical protein M1837_004382 [Sclerophora amabilis]